MWLSVNNFNIFTFTNIEDNPDNPIISSFENKIDLKLIHRNIRLFFSIEVS